MNLISCDHPRCGVVLDLDKIDIPEIYNDDDCVIEDNAYWSGSDYLPKIKCPACGRFIKLGEN